MSPQRPSAAEGDEDEEGDDFAGLPSEPVASPSAALISALAEAEEDESDDDDDESYDPAAQPDSGESDWDGAEEELVSEDELRDED